VAIGVLEEPITDAAALERGLEASAAHILGGQLKRELARELHDQVAQTLTSLLVQMENFKRDNWGRQGVVDEVNLIQSSLREVLNNLRQLLSDLRGEPGLRQDFVIAIRSGLLDNFQRRTGISVTLSASRRWPAVLPPETYIHLYRIIQEALNNAHKHARATTAIVSLKVTPDDRIVVKVRDDGCGISWREELNAPLGMGLLGMRERASLLGGVLSVRSHPGCGTTVTATFPKEALTWSLRHAPPAS
jgi:two-component system sensor histidine kinase DegS